MRSTRSLLMSILALSLITTMIHAQLGSDAEYSSFGDEINPLNASDYTEIIDLLETKDTVEAKMTAMVDEVCQMKGCWMNVSAPESEVPIFVQFKDYGFFVPMDIAGKEVILQGIAYKKMTSVEDLRHYAKDAGKSEKEIDEIAEPREEISFMASGVLVKN